MDIVRRPATLTIAVGDLDVAYAVAGSQTGPAVLLLHGWPDDISTWDSIAAQLALSGFRTIVPALRGFGPTRFRAESASRTGDTGILAIDAIGLMDALGIERFAVIGHDWGSSVAEALAVGWPNRVERIAMLATAPRLGGLKVQSFEAAQADWYQWFMATLPGEQAVREDPKGFARFHWLNWGPPGWFDEETFDSVALAWANPDWVSVTLHSYRSRWGVVPPDDRGAWLVEKVAAAEALSLPVMIIQGQEDGVSPPVGLEKMKPRYHGSFELTVLPNVGHFPQREAPDVTGAHIIRFLNGDRA